MVWHTETDLAGLDLVVLPGGFSYGDYLRCGAMAAQSPVMRAVREFAAARRYVLGMCNGFQILTEAGLLPGALLRNAGLRFICRGLPSASRDAPTPPSPAVISADAGIPRPDGARRRQLLRRRGNARPAGRRRPGRLPLRNAAGAITAEANRNGSARTIAGIYSPNLRVLGLMPHPEDLVDPLMGGTDGKPLFDALAGAGG